jgi:hypothetical protein
MEVASSDQMPEGVRIALIDRVILSNPTDFVNNYPEGPPHQHDAIPLSRHNVMACYCFRRSTRRLSRTNITI